MQSITQAFDIMIAAIIIFCLCFGLCSVDFVCVRIWATCATHVWGCICMYVDWNICLCDLCGLSAFISITDDRDKKKRVYFDDTFFNISFILYLPEKYANLNMPTPMADIHIYTFTHIPPTTNKSTNNREAKLRKYANRAAKLSSKWKKSKRKKVFGIRNAFVAANATNH